MSMFTPSNGPSPIGSVPSGPASVTQITDLINAYSALAAKLNNHIEDDYSENVHEVKTQVEDYINNDLGLPNAVATLQAQVTKIGDLSSLSTQEKSNLVAAINELVAAINLKASTSVLNSYKTQLEEADSELDDKIDDEKDARISADGALQDALDALSTTLTNFMNKFTEDNNTLIYDGILKATVALKGKLYVDTIVDYTKWATVKAQYAGTGSQIDVDTEGLFVLGMLSENFENVTVTGVNKPKAGRAFIKYVNDEPFDAIVNMTATGLTTGELVATVSKESTAWAGMTFVLVKATDQNGASHAYLCISGDDATALCEYNFYVAGENFIPANSPDYIALNGVISNVTSALCYVTIPSTGGTAISNMSIDTLAFMSASEALAIWNAAHEE